ncbi:hypothetical protein FRC03_012474 [Tulasnella sp. 419]|nr:hypothetical protein FRC03_012474 [Tulasnella sp. 419]
MNKLPTDAIEQALALLLGTLPPPDESTTKSLIDMKNQEADRLEFVLSAFEDHVRKRISSIRRYQNSTLPVYRLPSELLLQVICELVDGVYLHRRYCLQVELASVSSRWHSLVMSSPRLWNTLSDTLKPGMVKFAIQRSGGATLNILITSWFNESGPSFISSVEPLMAQWRSLTLSHLPSEVEQCLFDQELPSLESLVFPELLSTPEPTSPLNIRAPNLKKLIATGNPYPLRIEPGLHSNLTVLRCSPWMIGAPFLLEHYHIILSSAPYLQEVHFAGTDNSGFATIQSITPFDIRLPHLRHIGFQDSSYAVIGFLLSSIVTATERHPSVSIMGNLHGDFSHLFRLSPPKHSLARRIFQSSQWLEVDMGVGIDVVENIEESVVFQWGVEDECLLHMCVFWEQSLSEQALAKIIQVGWFSNINKLKIKGLHFFRNSLVATHLHHHHLSKLETLQIGSINKEDDAYHSDLEHVLQIIASPLSSIHHPFGILPELRHLIMDTGPFDLNCLIELIKNRTISMDTEPNCRTRLETLILTDAWAMEDPLHETLLEVLQERGVRVIVPDYELW